MLFLVFFQSKGVQTFGWPLLGQKSVLLIVSWAYGYEYTTHKTFAMNRLQNLMERSAFGVCTFLGRFMGLSTSTVRLYFIYLSFVALGSPVLVYLFLAFWLNIRRYLGKKTVLWE